MNRRPLIEKIRFLVSLVIGGYILAWGLIMLMTPHEYSWFYFHAGGTRSPNPFIVWGALDYSRPRFLHTLFLGE